MTDIAAQVLDADVRIRPHIRETLLARSIPISKRTNAHVFCKYENLQHTGSFKARGLAVAVSRAKELGAKALSIPSAGNAAGALSAYAALAGLPAYVFMPRDVPRTFVAECRALGAEVTLVDGLITDCGRVAAEGVRQFGRFDVSTLKEPYRLEGKKTMGYELAEQMDWHLPDVIIYPTGGGTGLIGMWKAFAELGEFFERPVIFYSSGMRARRGFSLRKSQARLFSASTLSGSISSTFS